MVYVPDTATEERRLKRPPQESGAMTETPEERMHLNRLEFKLRLLDTINQPHDEAMRAVMERLTITSTGVRLPLFPSGEEEENTLFEHDHPSLMQRIATTSRWKNPLRTASPDDTFSPEAWNAMRFLEELEQLALILYREDSEELCDLAIALWQRAAREQESFNGERNRASLSAAVKTFHRRTVQEKPSEPWNDWTVLMHAFGERLQQTFLANNPTTIAEGPAASIRALLRAGDEKADTFWHVVSAFKRWMAAPDMLLAGSILREGFSYIGTIQEVTDDEWHAYVATQQTPQNGEKQETRARANACADIDATAIHAFLERLQEPPSDHHNLRTLSEIIDCDRWRKELEHERSLNVTSLAATEVAVASHAFAKVVRYPYGTHDRSAPTMPGYMTGLPAYLVRERAIICSTGPWLLARMLLQCGIPASQLFYCNILAGEQLPWAGSHGTLAFRTSKNAVLLFDTALGICGKQLPIDIIQNQAEKRQLIELLQGTRKQSTFVNVNPSIARVFRLPQSMQIMPLMTGFASTNLHHLGHTFFAEGKKEEAKRAWEVGLAFHPEHPDMWYSLGLLAFQEGRTEEAEEYLWNGLHIDRGNLLCHFTLGELALQQGTPARARKHFQYVTKDKREIWADNDGTIKMKAVEYMLLNDEEMLRAWQCQDPFAVCNATRRDRVLREQQSST